MSGVSQKESREGPGIWKRDAEVCGALEMSEPESSARKPPIKEELTSLKGKAVLLSPPTLGPVGFAHFCTHHQSFAPGLAFRSLSVSQLWVGLGSMCVHSETVYTGRLLLVHWLTPAEKHSANLTE